MGLLKELHAQGNTLVLITHDNEIAAQAPRRVRLLDGRIVSDSGVPEGKNVKVPENRESDSRNTSESREITDSRKSRRGGRRV